MSLKTRIALAALFGLVTAGGIIHHVWRQAQPFPECTAARVDPQHRGEYQLYSGGSWLTVLPPGQQPLHAEAKAAERLTAKQIVRYYTVEDGNSVVLYYDPNAPSYAEPVWGVWTKDVLARVKNSTH